MTLEVLHGNVLELSRMSSHYTQTTQKIRRALTLFCSGHLEYLFPLPPDTPLITQVWLKWDHLPS